MQKRSIAVLASTGVAGLVAGAVLMTGLSANAADDSSSGSTSGSSSYGGTAADGHSNGTDDNALGDPTKPMRDDEELLTGDALAKVTAAVKAKYPDATIQRVETDSDGVYEAHIVDNGKPVTVEVDKSYAITGTESAPAGAKPNGEAPAA
jgi:hypothetical protein